MPIEDYWKGLNNLTVLEPVIEATLIILPQLFFLHGTQKSSKVVESLKNALKKGRADKKVSVNVHKSIRAVMEVIDDEIQSPEW